VNEWLQLRLLILESLKHIPRPQDLNSEMSIQEIEGLELRMSADIDASVRAFARQQQWPKISPKESFFLYHRFEFGSLVADSLATPEKSAPAPRPSIFPNPPESFWQDSQLEWLLVSAWEYAGRRFWIERGLFRFPVGYIG
jgi:hypothetical protein